MMAYISSTGCGGGVPLWVLGSFEVLAASSKKGVFCYGLKGLFVYPIGIQTWPVKVFGPQNHG